MGFLGSFLKIWIGFWLGDWSGWIRRVEKSEVEKKRNFYCVVILDGIVGGYVVEVLVSISGYDNIVG